MTTEMNENTVRTENGMETAGGYFEYNVLENTTRRAQMERARAEGVETWMAYRRAGGLTTVETYHPDGTTTTRLA